MKLTRKEFATQTGYKMSYDEYVTCYCPDCDKKNDCIHHDAYRKLPEVEGGLGLCPRLVDVEKAKKLIADFQDEEFDDDSPDFSDLENIPLVFTTLGDEEVPVQIDVDLVNWKIKTYIGESEPIISSTTLTDLEFLDLEALISGL